MSDKHKDKRDERGDSQPANPGQPAAQGPGVPPIQSAPTQGQSASAFVQPAQTVPDGDPRFAQRDAGTPYVVGLGHVSANPSQYRNDQDKAAEDKDKADKEDHGNKDQGEDQDQQK